MYPVQLRQWLKKTDNRHQLILPFNTIDSSSMSFEDELDMTANAMAIAFRDIAASEMLELLHMYAEAILVSEAVNQLPEQEGLLASIVLQETRYRNASVSSVGAIGAAQVRPEIWAKHCAGELSEMYANIQCAGQVLRTYYESKTCNMSWDCALRVYNVGPANFKKHEFKVSSWRYMAQVKRFQARFKDALKDQQSGVVPG